MECAIGGGERVGRAGRPLRAQRASARRCAIRGTRSEGRRPARRQGRCCYSIKIFSQEDVVALTGRRGRSWWWSRCNCWRRWRRSSWTWRRTWRWCWRLRQKLDHRGGGRGTAKEGKAINFLDRSQDAEVIVNSSDIGGSQPGRGGSGIDMAAAIDARRSLIERDDK